MITPKDLLCPTFWMIRSLIVISTLSFWTDNLCLNPIIISSVLATFKLGLLTFSRQLRLLNSGGKVCLSSVNVLAGSEMFVSSASIFGAAARRQLGISLI